MQWPNRDRKMHNLSRTKKNGNDPVEGDVKSVYCNRKTFSLSQLSVNLLQTYCFWPLWTDKNESIHNPFSTVMIPFRPGPAFQECTGSSHKNVPARKAVSSNLGSTDGLNVLAQIEIVAIMVCYQPSYTTLHTQWNPATHCCSPMSLCAAGYILQA